MSKPPDWLEGYQAQFSAMLRVPLDRSSGTLRATVSRYPAELCEQAVGGAERLAAYNRQYWFRLFTTLQAELPLTSALLGAWELNRLAERFLIEHPPHGRDLAQAADGFHGLLERELPTEGIAIGREPRFVPRLALLQAARIDDAFRTVFRAPEQARFVLTAEQAERMPRSRLRGSLAVQRIEEDWPLLALRRAVKGCERPIDLPPAHPEARHVMICRSADGFREVPLEAGAAQLMRLLETRTISDALAELEHATPEHARARLAADTQRWLAEGMRLGYWTGLEPAHQASAR